MKDEFVLYRAGDRSFESNEMGFGRPVMMSFSASETAGAPSKKLRMHPYLCLLYFESGNGVFETNGQRYAIHTNDLFLVNRNQKYRFYNEISNVPLVSYCFLVNNLRLFGGDPDVVADDGFVSYSYRSPDNTVLEYIRQIYGELKDKAYSYHTKADAYFTLMLADVVRLLISASGYTGVQKESPYYEDMAKVRAEIDASYTGHCDLVAIARAHGTTKRELLVRFRDVYHKSAVRYLEGLRLAKAKKLLLDKGSGMSVEEVAIASGFDGEINLQRAFKRLTGITLKTFLNVKKEGTSLVELPE